MITPRWLFVLAGATPERFRDPMIVDKTLDPFRCRVDRVRRRSRIGIHTFNSLHGCQVRRLARERGSAGWA